MKHGHAIVGRAAIACGDISASFNKRILPLAASVELLENAPLPYTKG